MRAYLCFVAAVASLIACVTSHDSSSSSAPSTAGTVSPTIPVTPSASASSSVQTNVNVASTGTDAGVTTDDGGADASVVVDAGPPPDDVNMTSLSTTYNGATRSYLLGTPRDYDPTKAYPLVMLFHGNPGTKEQMRSLIQFEGVSHTDAILVYPDAYNEGGWDLYTPTATNVDMSFIHALPGILAASLNIDTTRIYGFGFSGGSFFMAQFTCRFGDLFRAVAINSGGGPNEQQNGNAQRADGCYICPAGPVSALVVHGDADTVVDYQSGVFTARCISQTDSCASTTTPTPLSPCVTYDSCTSGKPIEFCGISGLNHAPWVNAQTEAWRFFNAAPALATH